MGVTLDVRNPLGKRVFKELLKDADVLVEANPPKVMEELGLDYNSIKDINPALIVTSITQFGQTGPVPGLQGNGSCLLPHRRNRIPYARRRGEPRHQSAHEGAGPSGRT